MTRDFSPLYRDGRCVICGEAIAEWLAPVHGAYHLTTSEAVIQIRYDREPPTEQVVPTESLRLTKDCAEIWDNDHDSWTHKDTNSTNLRNAIMKTQARAELAATRQRVARAAREAK